MNRSELLKAMLRIRRIEEAVADEYPKQEMRCPVHLSIGQEAVPVALSAQLTVEDHVFSTHRCHAHYLAKGGSLNAMMAELFGKSTGCARGKGGSMHLVDVSQGMMGSSALVGGTIPMATGSALSMKMKRQKHLAVAYLGDGATEEGIFYESINFAALKKLPVLFVVENNLYATYSHQRARQATDAILSRGASFGVPGVSIDGNDVEACYKAFEPAIERARNGEGPSVMEFRTYRWRDHVGPNFDIPVGYRTQDELDGWMRRCPIDKLKMSLLSSGEFSSEAYEALEKSIRNEIEMALAFARQSPLPEPLEVSRNVYAPA